MSPLRTTLGSEVALSFVIPVYNGSQTISAVVDRIARSFDTVQYEVILVNDGSQDDSERTCRRLAAEYPGIVRFIHLARNFGEHNAVLAGLRQTSGQAVAVLDDDGQNPPEEVWALWDHLQNTGRDVVYGRYRLKQHSWFRNFGSRFNDRMANWLLKKPKEIYLSSFKVMNRFLVNEVIRYRGPFPYIDGLIFRTTRNIGQIEVEHRERLAGQSNYTLRRLVRLWLNMFLGFSIAPLRISVVVGLLTSLFSIALLFGIVIDKIAWNPDVPVGIPTVLTCIALFAGVQLTVLGMIGEYVGRVFLEQNGTPQYVVRYLCSAAPKPATTDRSAQDTVTEMPAISPADRTSQDTATELPVTPVTEGQPAHA
jgi:glycosyltransferase involved in cell wall biosynthesis